VDPGNCESGLFCVDGVCCDSPCDSPDDQCDLPGLEGTCRAAVAPAPSASHTGLAIATILVAAIGVFAIRRRRDLRHYLWSV